MIRSFLTLFFISLSISLFADDDGFSPDIPTDFDGNPIQPKSYICFDTDMFLDPIDERQARALWEAYQKNSWYSFYFEPVNETGMFRRTWHNSRLNPSGSAGVQLPVFAKEPVLVANRFAHPRVGQFFAEPLQIFPMTVSEWREHAVISRAWGPIYSPTHQGLLYVPEGQLAFLSLAGDIPRGPMGSMDMQGELVTPTICRAIVGVDKPRPKGLPAGVVPIFQEPIPSHLCGPFAVSSSGSVFSRAKRSVKKPTHAGSSSGKKRRRRS